MGRNPGPTARQPANGDAAHEPVVGFSGVTVPLFSRFTEKAGISGLPKLGWLNTLKKSARSSMFIRSPSFVFFEREKSKLWNAGPRKALRRRFPKCAVPAMHPPATGSQSHGAASAVKLRNW